MTVMGNIPKEYIGEFWLPDEELKKISGELIISQGEFILRTINSFEYDLLSNKPIDIVFGIVKDKEDNATHNVILYNLYTISNSISELNITKYFINTCLINKSGHVATNVSYHGIQLFSDVLSSILLKHNFNHVSDKINKQIHLTYQKPEDIVVFKSNTIEIKIAFDFEQVLSRGVVSMTETQSVLIDITFSKYLDYFLRFRQKLERWIAVILGTDFKFDTGKLLNTNGKYYRIIQGREYPDLNILDFKRELLIAQLQTTYKNWLMIDGNNSDAINTFFFAFSDFKMDIYSKFLNYVIALEKLHRLNYPNKYLPKKRDAEFLTEFEKLKIKGDLKSWIEKQLKKEKTVILADRLKDLVNDTDSNLKENTNKLDKDEIKKIVDTRHYLAHLDETQKANMLQTVDILRINEKLVDLFLTFVRMKISIQSK